MEVGFKRAIHTGFSYAVRLHLRYIESVSYSQKQSYLLEQEHSATISVIFCSSSDFEFLVLKGISKCLQISLSILHLKEESLFSLAISQRLNTSYISGCLTPIASTTASLVSFCSCSSFWHAYSSAAASSISSSSSSVENSFKSRLFSLSRHS